MFKKLFGSNKIKVELVEALSDETFDIIKMPVDQLPVSFDKPTTIHIAGEEWSVEKAEPVSGFAEKGKLILWVKKVFKMDPRNIRYSIPTISNELPATSSTILFHDFTLTIHEDDWRQMEFLPAPLLPTVQEEMKGVEEILFPGGDEEIDSLNGFDRIHVRSKISNGLLSIPVDEFIRAVPLLQKGNLAIDGHTGYVENGFAFRSADHTYYGAIRDNLVTTLCLNEFSSMDEEVNRVITDFNLLFVCWCRGTIAAG